MVFYEDKFKFEDKFVMSHFITIFFSYKDKNNYFLFQLEFVCLFIQIYDVNTFNNLQTFEILSEQIQDLKIYS